MKREKCNCTPIVYSRICGYYSGVNKDWHAGKREEFKDRKLFKINGEKMTLEEQNKKHKERIEKLEAIINWLTDGNLDDTEYKYDKMISDPYE